VTGPRRRPVTAIDSTPAVAPEPSSTLGRRGWLAIGTLMLATILINIASVCLFPQIMNLSEEFGRPVNQVVWTMAGFHVIAAGAGAAAAALGAIVGNRRMLAIALGLLLVGSVIAGLADNLPLLIAGRVIQGVSMAIQALSIGIVASFWRGAAMRRAMSMIVLAMGLGAVVAYLLSGLLWRAGGDWRTLFWIITVAAAVDLGLTFAFIKETRPGKGVRVDYLGCIGLVAWTVLILLPLSQANSWGWGSTRLLSLLLPGVALLILWVAWELRAAAPLIDLRLLKRTGAWQGALVWLTIALGFIIPASFLPYLLQTPASSGFGFGTNMFVVSLTLATSAVAMSVFSPTAAGVMRRLGPKGTMLLGILFSLNAFGMAFAHGSLWLVILWLALNGIPASYAGSASYAVAAEAVEPEKGVVLGTIYNAAAGIGCTISSAVVGYMLTLRQVAVEVTTPQGVETQLFPADVTFTWSALITCAMAVISIAAVAGIRSKHLRFHEVERLPVEVEA
jgi:MFS family permease